jgi:hypothetical protein
MAWLPNVTTNGLLLYQLTTKPSASGAAPVAARGECACVHQRRLACCPADSVRKMIG